jgi:hypothetical protein
MTSTIKSPIAQTLAHENQAYRTLDADIRQPPCSPPFTRAAFELTGSYGHVPLWPTWLTPHHCRHHPGGGDCTHPPSSEGHCQLIHANAISHGKIGILFLHDNHGMSRGLPSTVPGYLRVTPRLDGFCFAATRAPNWSSSAHSACLRWGTSSLLYGCGLLMVQCTTKPRRGDDKTRPK